MDLYLQFGYGMMKLSLEMAERWGGGCTILSPRDLTRGQMGRLGPALRDRGAEVMLDPQFYLPRADHHGLTQHSYWPQEFDTGWFFEGPALGTMLSELADYNTEAQCSRHILPGVYAPAVDDRWFAVHEAIIANATNHFPMQECLQTICLSSESLRSEQQIHSVLERAEHWPVTAYYVVPEHPRARYLVDDPSWLANLLDLCAGLKLLSTQVVCGYANQQMLCLATANVDAVASGNWMNVRAFPPDKFLNPADETRRHALWYYCPQVLSEFRLPFLDMAFRAGRLDLLRADPALESYYADSLFAGGQPSSVVGFRFPDAFRHFLQCLHHQVANARRPSFRETVDAHEVSMIAGENLLEALHDLGVRGQDRDFADGFDVNRAAVGALVRARGFVLDRQW
jgi:hypothetical protein